MHLVQIVSTNYLLKSRGLHLCLKTGGRGSYLLVVRAFLTFLSRSGVPMAFNSLPVFHWPLVPFIVPFKGTPSLLQLLLHHILLGAHHGLLVAPAFNPLYVGHVYATF